MFIHKSVEPERGCGFRKPDKTGVGIYLVGPADGFACGRLPYPLKACPCCGGGIKPSRSWTWIEPVKLLEGADPCPMHHKPECCICPMGGGVPEGKHGLLWIGGSHYKTPEDFMRETARMGASRKLPVIPQGFELGKTWVYLAHREAVPPPPLTAVLLEAAETGKWREPADLGKAEPGIFTVFKPNGVDLVVEPGPYGKLTEKAEKRAKQLLKRLGKEEPDEEVRLVKVLQEGEQQDLEV